MTEEGLRDRKRRRTRAAIADTGMRLFLDRGFDQVSVVDTSAAAEVSEKTVYNYFASKAELFFDEGDDLLTELLHAVRTRAPGESALDAVRGFVGELAEWAAPRRPVRPSPACRRLIADSPACRPRGGRCSPVTRPPWPSFSHTRPVSPPAQCSRSWPPP